MHKYLIAIIVSFLFVQISNTSAETVKIGIITDVHKCGENISTDFLNKFKDYTNEIGTNFNINLGDSASYRVFNCSSTAKNDFSWVSQKLNAYTVLSDHDINGKESLDYWKKETKNRKTYFSFDKGDVHVIVLDTITGTGEITSSCANNKKCAELSKKSKKLKDTYSNKAKLQLYLSEKNISLKKFLKKKKEANKALNEKQKELKKSKTDYKDWDKGNISNNQIEWLKKDLKSTIKSKIVIFSDHPLFDYSTSRKSYSINNLSKVQNILQTSNKEVVSISGETHTWYEEKINGIQYYLIDQFQSSNGSWAIFQWDDNGYSLTKVTH